MTTWRRNSMARGARGDAPPIPAAPTRKKRGPPRRPWWATCGRRPHKVPSRNRRRMDGAKEARRSPDRGVDPPAATTPAKSAAASRRAGRPVLLPSTHTPRRPTRPRRAPVAAPAATRAVAAVCCQNYACSAAPRLCPPFPSSTSIQHTSAPRAPRSFRVTGPRPHPRLESAHQSPLSSRRRVRVRAK